MKKKGFIKRLWVTALTTVIMVMLAGAFPLTLEAADTAAATTGTTSQKAVVKIGKKKYSSLEKAIRAVKKGQKIQLLQDISWEGEISEITDKKFTLDLNKHTITFLDDMEFGKDTNITLINGKLKIPKSNGASGISMYAESTVTIRNCTISAKGIADVIELNKNQDGEKRAKLILEKCKASLQYNRLVCSFCGNVTVKSGTYKSNEWNNSLIQNYGGKLTIKNGTFKGSVCNEDYEGLPDEELIRGECYIYNGNFSAVERPTIQNEGRMTINGGKIIATGNHVALLNFGGESPQLTFNGGVATSYKREAVICGYNSKTILNGGKIISKKSDVIHYAKGAKIVQSGTKCQPAKGYKVKKKVKQFVL